MSGAMNVRQKLLKGRALVGHVNVAPTVTITAYDSLVTLNVSQKGFKVVATDSEQGDVSDQVTWTGYKSVASGYQTISFGYSISLTDSTGLVNFGSPIPGSPVGSPEGSPYPAGSPFVFPGSPVGSPEGGYKATVAVDGGSAQQIVIYGSSAQTVAALINELNADTTGATWSLSDGNLVCTSSSSGGSPSSSISVVDQGLFAALQIGSPIGSPAVTTINAAVAGTTTTGLLGTGAGPTLTFTVIGTQSVVASFTDSYGVTATDSVQIEVAGSPVGSPAP